MSNYHEQFLLECDELDAQAIHAAIARCQREAHAIDGTSTLPDGDGNMAGRVIAEICRSWQELMDYTGGA